MAMDRLLLSALLIATLVAAAPFAHAQAFDTAAVSDAMPMPFRPARELMSSSGRGRSRFVYNASLLANLTSDSSGKMIGGVMLNLYYNTFTKDHDMSFLVAAKVPSGDKAKSVGVFGSSFIFTLTGPRRFRIRRSLKYGRYAVASGVLRKLSNLKTPSGETYIQVVTDMLASAGNYSAVLGSRKAPNGLARGEFEAKVFTKQSDAKKLEANMLGTKMLEAKMHKKPHQRHTYNISLVANLTNSKSKRVGGVILNLFMNNETNDYDLTYGVGVYVRLFDKPTSALVLNGTSTSFKITAARGFKKRRFMWYTAGIFRNISQTYPAVGSSTYADIITDMILTPTDYSAQVVSRKFPAGVAAGIFGTYTFNHTDHHGGRHHAGRRALQLFGL